jgi:hypothetical protein
VIDREPLTQHELDPAIRLAGRASLHDVRFISPHWKIAVKSASERAGRWGAT